MLGLGLSIPQVAVRALGTGGGSGAPASDPIIQSINADGWSITANATPPTMAPDSDPKSLYVTRAGFDSSGNATSFVDQLIMTTRLRLPAPNDTTLTADKVVLSDYVYATDTAVGITNDSIEVSPKPVANWALPDRQTVGNTLHLEIVAFHRDGRAGKPVACVVFRATDGVNTVTQTVSTPTILAHSGDKNPVVGYPCDLDISTLSAGVITVNAKVYPVVGGAASVLDSADSAVEREFSPKTYVKSASGPLYIYVASTGNDTTGVLSATAATAKATPCTTLAGAYTRARAQNGTVMDNVVIRLAEGNWALSANNASGTYNTAAECIIERDPDAAFEDVTYTFGGNFNTRLAWGRLRNLKLARVTTGLGVLMGRVVFENCTLDTGGFTAQLNGSSPIYVLGLSVTGTATSILTAGTGEVRLVRGLSGAGITVEDRLILGCELSGGGVAASLARMQNGCIIGFNRFMSHGGSSASFRVGISGSTNFDVVGYALIQNVIEWATSDVQASHRPSGDGETSNITHLLNWHNTFAGFAAAGRWNFLYDESAGTTRRTHKLCSAVGDLIAQMNHKTDKWVHYTNANADSVNRTGAWPITMGVGFRGLFTMFAAPSANERLDYPGLNASIGTSSTVRNDPLFTDDKAATAAGVAGAGGGDYSLQAGSPCIGRTRGSPLPFDLAGSARSPTASASGAYERLA